MEDLPQWCYVICLFTSVASILISGASISLQLTNYRKPFEQRLIVRILVVVPMFAVTCYSTMVDYRIGRIIEPVREIYEAFVIYTFYKLLVLMLGGERHIIQKTVNKRPTDHPFPTNLVLNKIHISDPSQFLTIKRCILQYVWVKPLIYIMIFTTSILGFYDVNKITLYSPVFWFGLFYNVSVTLSLYYLAMFWKCLYDELRLFNPWRKFLCVKLIIFASYWQGLLIGLLNILGVFSENEGTPMVYIQEKQGNLGIKIQNGLLCFEMIFFAWMHWQSFPFTDFTSDKLVDSARVNTWIALKDCISIGDLIHDIKMTTLYGDSYNLKNFDSKADSNVYAGSETFNKKIYQGLRMSSDGKRYWINDDDISNSNSVHDTDKQSKRSFNYTGDGRRRQSFSGSISSRQFIADNKTPLLNSGNTKSSYTGNEYRYHNDLGDLVETYATADRQNVSDSANDEESSKTVSKSVESEPFLNDDEFNKDDKLYRYVKMHPLTAREVNYPVEYEYKLSEHSSRIERLRKTIQSKPEPEPAIESDFMPDASCSA